MKSRFGLVIVMGLAFAAPLAMATAADAASRMERNTRVGPGQDEQSGFEAAAPGIAAHARYEGRSGWKRHHHRRHHHMRY